MYTHSLVVIGMRQHNSFGLSGRSRGINQRSQIVGRTGISTPLHFFADFLVCRFSHCYQVFEINRRAIALCSFYIGIEKYQFFQRRTLPQGDNRIVVLHLTANEQESYLCLIDNILYLIQRTGRVKRHCHRTVIECSEIHDKTFRFILRICRNIFFFANTQYYHSFRHVRYLLCETVPRSRNPSIG